MKAMKTAGMALGALLACSLSAQAALAPNYQRARELGAVVDAVAAAVERHAIDSVTYVGNARYEAVAGPCKIVARIVSEPMPDGMVGAARFRVELDEPECSE